MYRTLHHAMLCMVLITASVYTSQAQCPAVTPLAINAATTTESRCPASGTATISVSGGSAPYTYSIITGPTILPPQSSNVLQSLAPGAYTVQVNDRCNTTVTRNFTVTGNYAVPLPTITTQPPGCANSSDGSITISVNGRPPFTYSLINPSPVIRGPQAGNVFTGLPAGIYTCRVTDSCSNFQTRTVTLSAPANTASLNSYTLQYISCDSFAVIMNFNIAENKSPYTITASPPGGPNITHVLTPEFSFGTFNDTFRIRFHHTTGAVEQMPVIVSDRCGVSSTGNVILSTNMDLSVNSTLPAGCGTQYNYTFERGTASLRCGSTTYTLVSPSGTVLATQTNNSTFSGFPPASGYKVIRQECCRRDSLTFDWAAPPAFRIAYTQNLPYATCREGTLSLFITFNFESQPADIVLVSGPPSVRYRDGTVHTYRYPDTTREVWSGAILGYFGPGTYKMYAINNSCGQKDSITITFTDSDIRHTVFTSSLVKGCTGDNKLLFNATSNTGWAPGLVTADYIFSGSLTGPDNSASDSAMNVSAGTYPITYYYGNYYSPVYVGMDNPGCDVLRDTIVVPVYEQPRFNPVAAVATCGAIRQVALLPDSTSGVAPYQFQLISGPTPRPMQASPVFTGMASGTYTFLMADACFNSYSHNITIDTLSLPGVVTSGSTCVGNAAMFTLPASPFYSYSWQRPNGSTTNGNTLSINPVTASDLGAYTISVTSNIAGCINTTSRSITLNPCQVLPQTLLSFNGNLKNSTVQLHWQTADEVNMGYHTVERSADGLVFTPVKQVAAKEGVLNNYTLIDERVPAGSVYYRIHSVEKNGAGSYSKIISFNNAHAQLFNVYPCLITGNTSVTVTCPAAGHTAYIRVIGVDGKVWRSIPVAAGVTQTNVDVSNLAKGSYFVVLTGNEGTMAAQIRKE